MDIAVYMHDFIQTKRAALRSADTIRHYKYVFDAYMRWAGERDYSQSDLYQSETIEQFLSDGVQRNLSPMTIHDLFRGLRALFRWLEDRKLLETETNPFDLLEIPRKTSKLPNAISYHEMQRLVLFLAGDGWRDHRDRLIIQLLFFCGIRASELCRLRVTDVDFERRAILVRRYKTRNEEFVPFPRSLAPELARWLEEVRPACNYDALLVGAEFNGSVVTPFHITGLQQMLRRRCLQAKVKVYRPHAFRHGCARFIVERGGDVSLVKSILGHKDVSSSLIYLRFNIDGTRDLYDRIFT